MDITPAQIKSLAKQCIGTWPTGIARHDRYYAVELAMSGMYTKLAEDPEATRLQLMNAGFNEVRNESRALNKARGLVAHGTSWNSRYHAYWVAESNEVLGDPESVVEHIVNKEAFARAWAGLSQVEKDAVIARARFDARRSYGNDISQEAADSLGIAVRTYRTRLQNARKAFRREWVAPCA